MREGRHRQGNGNGIGLIRLRLNVEDDADRVSVVVFKGSIRGYERGVKRI